MLFRSVESQNDKLSLTEKKINNLRAKILELVQDSAEVIHCAVRGETWNGKKITRTQLYAASPIVAKFSPTIDNVASGQVHLHLNIPRPKAIETVEVLNIAPKENKELKQG